MITATPLPKEPKEMNTRIVYLNRPGAMLSGKEFTELVTGIQCVAGTCFDTLPDYQCLRGTREELSDKVMAVAWREDGRMEGFCSAVLLPIKGVGEVLHLGLTCVRPDARSGGLTHKLTSHLLTRYLLRHPFQRVWVSNVACVLSSLGNVALHFDDVYPSPLGPRNPSPIHMSIALQIQARFRDKMYIRDTALFDPANFIFRGSVGETVFQKDEKDARFRHRDERLNAYYGSLMDFEKGDEVLQVGTCSLLTLVRYALRGDNGRYAAKAHVPRQEPLPAQLAA